jgi:hypothetical protein
VQQLTAAAPAAEQQQQQIAGEAAACRSAAECLAECQASVLQTLEQRKGENKVC